MRVRNTLHVSVSAGGVRPPVIVLLLQVVVGCANCTGMIRGISLWTAVVGVIAVLAWIKVDREVA